MGLTSVTDRVELRLMITQKFRVSGRTDKPRLRLCTYDTSQASLMMEMRDDFEDVGVKKIFVLQREACRGG